MRNQEDHFKMETQNKKPDYSRVSVPQGELEGRLENLLTNSFEDSEGGELAYANWN